MMTLDEAIKTCEENVHDETYGEEIRQLGEWLKELRWRRVKMDNFALRGRGKRSPQEWSLQVRVSPGSPSFKFNSKNSRL